MGGAAGAGLSAIGSMVTAGIQAKSQEKIAREKIESQEKIHESEAANREKYSQMTRADQDIARQNLLATEGARLNILGALGTPGTYGSPGARSVFSPGRHSLNSFSSVSISTYRQFLSISGGAADRWLKGLKSMAFSLAAAANTAFTLRRCFADVQAD